MLNIASCCAVELSTIVAIFSRNKVLAHIIGLKCVRNLSRIYLLPTAIEQYIRRAILSGAGVGRSEQ
jgi:hypothetical protein